MKSGSKLARRINELTAMKDVDGVVITHGTDTIEETGYFLNLVVKSKKPVVLTASMRPSTALSADGPLNFFNAVAVAANKDAAGRGVLVVVNDWIHGASSLTKASTTAVQTFLSPLRGLIGTVAYGEAEFYRGPVGRNTRGLGVLPGWRNKPAAGGHYHGPREHGRENHRRGSSGGRQGHCDCRSRKRQYDEERPRCSCRTGEEGNYLCPLYACGHGPCGSQRRSGRRQAGSDRIGRFESSEVACAASVGSAEEPQPGGYPANFHGVLTYLAVCWERRRLAKAPPAEGGMFGESKS